MTQLVGTLTNHISRDFLVVATKAIAGARSAEPEDYRTERSEGGYAVGSERSAPEVATIWPPGRSATVTRRLRAQLTSR